VRVDELAVVVDLACEVGIVFLCRLEHDLLPSACVPPVYRVWLLRTLEPLLSLCEAR
jgi:hypothetical protein